MDDTAKWLIWAFVGLGVAWFLTGGPEREIARQGVFLRPLAPIDSGQAYGGGYINSLYNNGKTELRLPKELKSKAQSPTKKLSFLKECHYPFSALHQKMKKYLLFQVSVPLSVQADPLLESPSR